MWNTRINERITALEGYSKGGWAIAFSSDGKILASGGIDKTIKLWNIQSGEAMKTIEAAVSVDELAFSPDGKFLYGLSSDKATVKL